MERRTHGYNSKIYHQSPAEKDVMVSLVELTRLVLTSTRTPARRLCYKNVVVLGLTGRINVVFGARIQL